MISSSLLPNAFKIELCKNDPWIENKTFKEPIVDPLKIYISTIRQWQSTVKKASTYIIETSNLLVDTFPCCVRHTESTLLSSFELNLNVQSYFG